MAVRHFRRSVGCKRRHDRIELRFILCGRWQIQVVEYVVPKLKVRQEHFIRFREELYQYTGFTTREMS